MYKTTGRDYEPGDDLQEGIRVNHGRAHRRDVDIEPIKDLVPAPVEKVAGISASHDVPARVDTAGESGPVSQYTEVLSVESVGIGE